MATKNREERLKFLLPAILVILGWVVVYQLDAYRDRVNKRRELRLGYLLESYRTLERTANRPEAGKEQQDHFEDALADIQLLGTQSQMVELRRFISTWNSAGGHGSISPLLEDLRADLRGELGLSNDVPRATIVRFTNRDPRQHPAAGATQSQ